MRFTAFALGAFGALALVENAAAQPTPTGDSPTSCDPSQTNCPPAPITDSPQSPPLINPDTVHVPPPPPPEPTFGGAMVPAPAPYRPENESLAHLGIGLVVGGGVDGFTNSNMRNTTNDGGTWNVRAIIGTRSPLALEAAYFGSAQSVNALGLDNNALLVGNGAQGDLRLNVGGDIPVQPFVFGGVAWRRYEITNTKTNTSDLVNNDNVLELPAGIGLAVKRYGFMAEARGEIRAAIGEDLVPNNTNGSESMHRWGVNASIGYEF